MDIIIAYRVNGCRLQFVMEEGEVAVFPDFDAAVSYTERNGLFQSGQASYQIIVLDEL